MATRPAGEKEQIKMPSPRRIVARVVKEVARAVTVTVDVALAEEVLTDA